MASRLNAYDNEFYMRVEFCCHSLNEAIKIRELLRAYDFLVQRPNSLNRAGRYERSEDRLDLILKKLDLNGEPISVGKLWKRVRPLVSQVSIIDYARDICMLILRGHIIGYKSDKRTMIKISEIMQGKFKNGINEKGV